MGFGRETALAGVRCRVGGARHWLARRQNAAEFCTRAFFDRPRLPGTVCERALAKPPPATARLTAHARPPSHTPSSIASCPKWWPKTSWRLTKSSGSGWPGALTPHRRLKRIAWPRWRLRCEGWLF